MSKSSKLTDEDIDLFRKAVENTIPLNHDGFITEKQKPRPHPAKTEDDNRAVIQEMIEENIDQTVLERGDELSFHRAGVQKQTLRKLRRGQFAIEAELDLHGLTVALAKPALAEFISDCIKKHKRCVRIIHGKGLGSLNKQPIIKNKANHWLQKNGGVMAFCSARKEDGGTGAVYLLLKRH